MALVTPVLLLILLFAIDFGRAFYSWIILQNASRIGANFASLNAQAWQADPDTASVIAEYEALIEDDLDNLACDPPAGPPPPPTFSDSAADSASGGQTPDTSYNVGDRASVGLTCTFRPITPIISAIVGANVQLSASSDFRVRAGEIAGLTNPATIPQPSLPTPTPEPTPVPTASCAAPVADFDPSTGPSGSGSVTVTFTDTSTTTAECPILTWDWTFEGADITTATGPGPHTVVFSKPPTQHDVELTVTSAGGSDTDSRNNFVRTN